MADAFGAGEGNQKKADGVADAINRMLQNLVIKCAKEEGIRDYFHVAVIGYGAQVGAAFSGALAGRQRGARSRGAASGVDRRSESIRAEHDVRRGTRLGAAVQRLVRGFCRLVARWNAKPRRDRSAVLAFAEHVCLQGSVGTSVEPVALADGGFHRPKSAGT